MSARLDNLLGGRRVAGGGAGTALFDPVLGDELVRVDATGHDRRAGVAFAREQGGAALRAMSDRERAAMLARAPADAEIELVPSHGRVHVVTPESAAHHSDHGNVILQSLHGGPGRAGGEELGGLRAPTCYHRRAAIQAGTTTLAALA